MILILTRHGETVLNKQGILQGHLPGELTDEGIMQAKKLAKRLKDEKIDAIYSSDLKRAADTAKEIAKLHPDAGFHLVKELREGDSGSFTGKKSSEVDWSKKPDDAESRKDIQKRAKKMIDKAYSKFPHGKIVFVGHVGINKALITAILNKPPEYMTKVPKQFNTSVTIFEIKEDKNHIVHLLNCVKHLD